MAFTTPWMLWLLGLAALPILIHLFNKWRHRSIQWAAIEFVLKAAKETKGRKKLLHYLILALRVLAIICLIFAFSRPLFSSLMKWNTSEIDELVILMDRSASMDTKPGQSVSHRETAISQLQSSLPSLPYKRLSLLDSATRKIIEIDQPENLTELSYTDSTDTASHLPALILRAINHFKEVGTTQGELWICSDMQQSNWDMNSPLWQSIHQELQSMAQSPKIKILAFKQRPQSNRSIQIQSSKLNNNKLELTFNVFRQGIVSQGAEDLPITINIGGNVSEIVIPVSGTHTNLFRQFDLPAQTKNGYGHISLPKDELTNDDIAYFIYDEAPITQVFVHTDQSDIKTLLHNMSAPPGIATRKVSNYQFKPSLHPGLIIWQGHLPSQEQKSHLLSMVEQGGSVLFLPPNDGQPSNPNSDILGIKWGAKEEAKDSTTFTVSSWKRDANILRDGVDQKSIPVHQFEAIQRVAIEGPISPLATYNDQIPLLGSISHGLGQIYFLNSLPDYSWSNLGDGQLLIPVIHRLASQTSDYITKSKQLKPGDDQFTHNQDMINAISDHETGIKKRTPLLHTGIYEMDKELYAINLSPEELSIDILDDSDLEKCLPGVTTQNFNTSTDQSSLVQEVWYLFLLLALACLLLEAYLCLPAPSKPSPTK